jgi:hypothetical protein
LFLLSSSLCCGAEDIAFKAKQKADAKAMAALKDQVASKGFVKTKVTGKK